MTTTGRITTLFSSGEAPRGRPRSFALAFTARGADASAACSALVSLARKGERALVLEIGLAAKSDAVRLVAANALWLAGDAEGLARFTSDRRKPIAALAELAIERLSE